MSALEVFGPITAAWFEAQFEQPTAVQGRGWRAIARGRDVLLAAPTGSGKTLAAFLWAIDRVSREPVGEAGTRILYISPLKALAVDVERNLRAPLQGIAQLAERSTGRDAEPFRPLRVDIRSGDTPAADRRRQARDPAEILVTTPESLYLLLGSHARENLRTVTTVIVDEIHSLAPSKRGAHLALSLERLAERCARPPQRIGLSATARPLDEVGRFLAGSNDCEIIDVAEKPRLDLTVEVAVADHAAEAMGHANADAGEADRAIDAKTRGLFTGEAGATTSDGGSWAAIYPELVGAIRDHRSTIVFVNSRALAERLTQRINDLAEEDLARAHHGSVSHGERAEIEDALKRGQLRAIVATSSLELGIDMGAVDLVVLVESPGSVARGLQRVGRAGHQVGEASRGRVYPKWKGDLLESAVVAEGMLAGAIEAIAVPRNPLDVLAQQLVAICCDRPRTVPELGELVRRAYPFAALPDDALRATLDMLSGRFPSTDLADLRPRLSWDRSDQTIRPRRGSALVARLNAGTIPDRGAFRVVLGEGGPRIGELDEEMVFESRPGDTFLLGASSWRIEEIGRDRVVVSPAPGEPGRLPFWRGDGLGRPVELGRAMGAFLRELGELDRETASKALRERAPLTESAARTLVDYVFDQREQGGALPTDRSIVIERFRDELGDWRICLLSTLGSRIHTPWALAIEELLGRRVGLDVQVLPNDDGIVLRLADGETPPPLSDLIPEPEEIDELVTRRVGASSLFASLFRENAVRSLLITRRRPDQRNPLWAQRRKSKALLATVERYPDFPIVLETYRQALSDVFDLAGLRGVLAKIRSREIGVHEVETATPSPFARSLAFAYVARYLYDADSPAAERRAQALTLDRGLLRELLGHAELRELLDSEAIAEVEAELGHRDDDRRARDPDELHDLLRRLGDLTREELAARVVPGADLEEWTDRLAEARRVTTVRVGTEARFIAAEDAGRYRDALGCALSDDLPNEFLVEGAGLAADESPFEFLVRRYARTHGPFSVEALASRFALRPAQVEPVLRALERSNELVTGEIRPEGTRAEWCDSEVLRRIKRRTLARLRGQIAAVDEATFARFLARWQGRSAGSEGTKLGLHACIEQIEGLVLPYSVLVGEILPARVADFRVEDLDTLGASGQLVWVGRGARGGRDGSIAVYRRDHASAWLEAVDASDAQAASSPLHAAILAHLADSGASFSSELLAAVRARLPDAQPRDCEAALWDLVWAGHVTNDTFQPLRARTGRRAGQTSRPGRPGSRRRLGRARTATTSTGGRWWLVSSLRVDPMPETERLLVRAETLLARYGVVSREAVRHEALEGGFASIYRVLLAMEEQGRIRRGWFVEGLSGAQFALSGALDRLRTSEEGSSGCVEVLPACDPANPYGALLAWPCREEDRTRLRRVPGAHVVLVDGAPRLYVPAGRRELFTLDATADGEALEPAIAGLVRLPRAGRRPLLIERIDGRPVEDSPLRESIEACGFVRDYGGWALAPGQLA